MKTRHAGIRSAGVPPASISRSVASFLLVILMLLLIPATCRAEDKPAQPAQPVTVKYKLFGLFSHEREPDLRRVATGITEVTLTDFDYEKGEVTFTYDPIKFGRGAKPKELQDRIDNLLRSASNQTFAVKPMSTIPREKLQKVEIGVGVLDCKACGYGLYQMVFNVPGVEQAFANYKEGLVTAWIDPEKTDRTKIAALLKQREVRVK